MADTALQIPSLKNKVSPEEWAVRVDLAACYRLVVRYGWEDLVFTHITARVPGTQDQFLINPYGVFFDEITASSLVKIDQEGRKLDDSQFSVNPAGFIIHSAIHGARHDAKCVLHTHTASGVAVSTQRAGLLPISQHSISVLASLGYHDFEGPALRDDEKPRLAHSAQPRPPHGGGDGGGGVREHVLPRDVVRHPGARAVGGRRAHSRAQGSDRRLLRTDAERGPSGRYAGRAGMAGPAAPAPSYRSLVP